MKLLIPLAMLAAVTAADVASAAPQTHGPTAHAWRATVRHRIRLVRTFQPVRHRMSPLALASAQASERATRASAADGSILPDSDHRGWLKDKDHAGWGWTDGRTETVMGLYRRNPRPAFVPDADLIQGGRGAAGVAVNLKLGG